MSVSDHFPDEFMNAAISARFVDMDLSTAKLAKDGRSLATESSGTREQSHITPPMLARWTWLTGEGNASPECKTQHPPETRDKAKFELGLTRGVTDKILKHMPGLKAAQEAQHWLFYLQSKALLTAYFIERPGDWAPIVKGAIESSRINWLLANSATGPANEDELVELEKVDTGVRDCLRNMALQTFIFGGMGPSPDTIYDNDVLLPGKKWTANMKRSVWRHRAWVKDEKIATIHHTKLPFTPKNAREVYAIMKPRFIYNPFDFHNGETGEKIDYGTMQVDKKDEIPHPWKTPILHMDEALVEVSYSVEGYIMGGGKGYGVRFKPGKKITILGVVPNGCAGYSEPDRPAIPSGLFSSFPAITAGDPRNSDAQPPLAITAAQPPEQRGEKRASAFEDVE